MLLCKLVQVEFPMKNGAPDFMDSWSADMRWPVGASVLTCESAMLLRGGGATAKDPQTGEEFTAALPFAHPDDRFASCLRRPPDTQELD